MHINFELSISIGGLHPLVAILSTNNPKNQIYLGIYYYFFLATMNSEFSNIQPTIHGL